MAHIARRPRTSLPVPSSLLSVARVHRALEPRLRLPSTRLLPPETRSDPHPEVPMLGLRAHVLETDVLDDLLPQEAGASRENRSGAGGRLGASPSGSLRAVREKHYHAARRAARPERDSFVREGRRDRSTDRRADRP